VDRHDSIVAARDEYCASESPLDILNGSTFGKQLEQDLGSSQPEKIPLALQTAVFEGGKEGGRIRIALDFPMDLLYRQWSQDWIEQATIGVLGMIYRRDGTLASRFSDFACCTPYSTGAELGTGLMSMDEFNRMSGLSGFRFDVASTFVAPLEKGTLPTRFETYVDLPAGEYDLQIILSDGKKFGRAKEHLKVERIDDKKLALSSVMLCNRYRDAHVAETEMRAANFVPQYVPMVSKGVQVNPAGDTTFSSSETLIAYFEIYKPQVATEAEPGIQVHFRIVDATGGGIVKDFPGVDAATYRQPGTTVIPIVREIPIKGLPKGAYRLEVQATDSGGRSTPIQSAEFSIK